MPLKQANWRNGVAFGHDAAAAALSWIVAYWLRFNFDVPPDFRDAMFVALLWVVPIQAAVLSQSGMYRGQWRYASLADMRRIITSAAVGALLIATFVLLFRRGGVPRSVVVIYPILMVALMSGSRIFYRAWKEGHLSRIDLDERKNVIILGAGGAAANLLRTVGRGGEWHFVGLLDDDPKKRGTDLYGVRVLGRIEALPKFVERLGVEQAIIAMPGQTHSVRRRAIELCSRAGIPALTVPAYEDLVSGRVRASLVRRVELDDLLGRDPVRLDSEGLYEWLHGRVVMVTGAGGSIGEELCRQLVRFAPGKLVLFEASEYALYRVSQEFQERFARLSVVPVIGDVKNAARLAQVMREHRPAVVFHAAAYKHVPLMEDENAWEALQNNALGTLRSAEAAIAHGVEKFVLVSTDKAVNPTSVMGATKRVAECVCESMRGNTTRFVAVRFGNVLGSTGSVIPRFRQQIAAGGPLTVTHPEVTRYFMSTAEAAQLVLQAGLMGIGGEIFMLDMGEPVKIADLARDMIRLSGFSEDEIKIVYTGLRPGEKLEEDLVAERERCTPTTHPKLSVVRPVQNTPFDLGAARAVLERTTVMSDSETRRTLASLVPEYQPTPREALPPLPALRPGYPRLVSGS
ncbi:MAG: nucleoside-diphosphate sugar epimerase/dehydratase [Burkholderiales bacterium]